MNYLEMDINSLIEKGLSNYNIADVRSESEYMHDHIPSAVNIPLLNDTERSIIGTIYKKQGPKAARIKGVEIVSPKLPDFINKFSKYNDKPIVLYCWRGGLRSESALTFLKLAGFDKVYRLTGGYKKFRALVNNFFGSMPAKFNLITLYGPTGCAKTEILEKLKSKIPVINLEKHALHKGSVFGAIGELQQYNITQKRFESKIWYDIYKNNFHSYFLTEGESKKIGKVVLPENFFKKMKTGISVVAEAPKSFRIDFTLKTYCPELYKNEIAESLMYLKRYLGSSKISLLLDLLNKDNFAEFTRILLEDYYDPLYNKSIPPRPDYKIFYDSVEEGTKKLESIYEEITHL